MGQQGNKPPFFDPTNPNPLLKPGFFGSHPFLQGLEGFPRPAAPAGADLQQALSLYHEELSRLQQSAIANAIKEQSRAADKEGEGDGAQCICGDGEGLVGQKLEHSVRGFSTTVLVLAGNQTSVDDDVGRKYVPEG